MEYKIKRVSRHGHRYTLHCSPNSDGGLNLQVEMVDHNIYNCMLVGEKLLRKVMAGKQLTNFCNQQFAQMILECEQVWDQNMESLCDKLFERE